MFFFGDDFSRGAILGRMNMCLPFIAALDVLCSGHYGS